MTEQLQSLIEKMKRTLGADDAAFFLKPTEEDVALLESMLPDETDKVAACDATHGMYYVATERLHADLRGDYEACLTRTVTTPTVRGYGATREEAILAAAAKLEVAQHAD